MLQGWKTYIVVGVMLLAVAVEKGLGLDVPGITVADDWLLVVLNALSLGTLRAGVANVGKSLW